MASFSIAMLKTAMEVATIPETQFEIRMKNSLHGISSYFDVHLILIFTCLPGGPWMSYPKNKRFFKVTSKLNDIFGFRIKAKRETIDIPNLESLETSHWNFNAYIPQKRSNTCLMTKNH